MCYLRCRLQTQDTCIVTGSRSLGDTTSRLAGVLAVVVTPAENGNHDSKQSLGIWFVKHLCEMLPLWVVDCLYIERYLCELLIVYI